MSTWEFIYRSAWVALAVLLVVGSGFTFLPKWREYRTYQERQAAVREDLRLEEEMLKVLKDKQDRFRSDPRFAEQIAHDLGLARPGEVLFKFRDDGSLPAPVVATNRARRP